MKKITTLIIASMLGISVFAQQDHAEFIEGPFVTPQEVTETCLICHEGVDQDIMKTRHWNWLGDEFVNKDGLTLRVGKQNIINNYCIAVPSNWGRCTSCHIGYGWEDNTFDFTDGTNIDCLVCHDQTGTYKKVPTGAGMPDPTVDLVKVAQSVGKTTINNCAICHFNGGGGTGVKHGDMDESLLNPDKYLDVHMGGLDYTCSTCHDGGNHQILGASHGSLAGGTNHIACTDCHEEKPHKDKLLNNHMDAIACETCHIPTFAREEPTKTWWDWSTAGQDKEDKLNKYGKSTYSKKKGDFAWCRDVIPEYRWHNGQADYYQYGEVIDPNEVVELNKLAGRIEDPSAKITPFKVMRGKQIYDSENNYLIVPKLFGEDGYWKNWDWDLAARLGMESIDLPYSGEYGFVETEMYWPVNHMVAIGKDALNCHDCHTTKRRARLDWEALGYAGDPWRTGGRFN
jgi:octaheme c-type cytochrome (tetrathionate reductase family)